MADHESLYKGPDGYVELTAVEHNGQRGALLRFINPDVRKLHAIDPTGMKEMFHAVRKPRQEGNRIYNQQRAGFP